MKLLNCPVEPTTWLAWTHHFAPAAQPFFLSNEQLEQLPHWPRWSRREFYDANVSLSVRDTLSTYSVAPEASWIVWFDEASFERLAPPSQSSLLQAQRKHGRGGVYSLENCQPLLTADEIGRLEQRVRDDFVLWPRLHGALSSKSQYNLLARFVLEDRLPCCRAELSEAHRQRLDGRFPDVRRMAGTFLTESGGNCLSTVMAAFGAPAVEAVWTHQAPFERWLEEATTSAKRFDLGTVLVWRNDAGVVQHAALSLGEGSVFHKESQTWSTPRQVMTLDNVLERSEEHSELCFYVFPC